MKLMTAVVQVQVQVQANAKRPNGRSGAPTLRPAGARAKTTKRREASTRREICVELQIIWGMGMGSVRVYTPLTRVRPGADPAPRASRVARVWGVAPCIPRRQSAARSAPRISQSRSRTV